MPRKNEGLEKVTVRLKKGDATKLSQFYPEGYNWAIRQLVSTHLKKLEEKQNQQDSAITSLTLKTS